jgi:hypothetical protein
MVGYVREDRTCLIFTLLIDIAKSFPFLRLNTCPAGAGKIRTAEQVAARRVRN